MTTVTEKDDHRRPPPKDEPPIRAYGPEALVRDEYGVPIGLAVSFDERTFVLPLKKVGTDENPVSIAWIDPSDPPPFVHPTIHVPAFVGELP
jgi:hypothetical protein